VTDLDRCARHRTDPAASRERDAAAAGPATGSPDDAERESIEAAAWRARVARLLADSRRYFDAPLAAAADHPALRLTDGGPGSNPRKPRWPRLRVRTGAALTAPMRPTQPAAP